MKPRLRIGVLATLATIFVLQLAATAHADAVTIRDPAFDLPHVCGDSDLEAARQQGYQAAKDRAGQFLLVMSVARGTLHAALGNLTDASEDDIVTRRTGYSRTEYRQMFEALPADAQAILEAYSDGVNNALDDMLKATPLIPTAFELRFFRQTDIAGPNNIFGNGDVLTQGQGADPDFVLPVFHPTYKKIGFQFTPELALAFAVLQIRNFGFEGWDETGMATSLEKLVDTYGALTGTQLWDDRYWINDPLSPVSVPDPRNPGFGGPLAKLSNNQKIELADAAAELQDRVLGRIRLPGYPRRDYSKALEPVRMALAQREQNARKWGAWPALGSYAMTISPARSATGNPWVGGFPQTGIQVPSIMHYTEVRGDTMKGNGMAFVGGPYVLIGHTDNVAYTTTTAHLKVIDTYIEELVGGDFNLFKYDAHGTTKDMVKRIENVYTPTSVIAVPVFRTNQTCSANGCNGGTRAVLAFSGEFAGTVDSATANSTTDAGVVLTPGALVGGHIAIVDGPGAGQIRAISGNTADTITVGTNWATTPDDDSEWVAVTSGEDISAVAMGTSIFMEEGEAATGFSRYQKSDNVMDIREALRFIPSTHNFLAADNQPYNGVGTDSGPGNIYYGTSGFHYLRQAGELDARLPLDGTGPEPFAVVSGVVDSAAASSLTDAGAFGGTYTSAAVNFTYDNPDDPGSEFVVQITAGNGIGQTRRISSNNLNTLTVEHPWGKIPSAGDTYTIYEIWATPEAMNPSEGFTANWNNKQSRATDAMLGENGRNHRVEMILEQLSLDSSIDRDDMRNLNKYVAGVTDPGLPGRYLLGRLAAAISAEGDCGNIDNELITQNGFPERGREFENPLIVAPAGTPVDQAAADRSADFIKAWATQLAADIYGDEYGAAGVSNLTGDAAIGWILHAIDAAEGDVTGSYSQVYADNYFCDLSLPELPNCGADWKPIVRDSFCDYVAANVKCVNDAAVSCTVDAQCDFGVCTGGLTCAGDAGRSCAANADCNVGPCSVGTKNRSMSNYNHPLAALPCQQGCATPIEFDPTPAGNRGTWEQIVEVGSTVKGEFIFPLGESGYNAGVEGGFTGNFMKQGMHTATMQPLWRDWRFVPMLDVCQDVTFGGDEDGDTDGDGVVDGFERWYYGNLTNNGTSDTDGDGASLATEWRWGSDPTLNDTDEDGTDDGNDVAPQDRLCIKGTLKKLSISDSATAGKDKVSAKWSVPLNVCIGSDYETACTTNADCGVVGRCRRIRVNPELDSVRILAAANDPALDADIPVSNPLWSNKDYLKFGYKDKDGVNGPVSKIKVQINEKKNIVSFQFGAKNMDVAAPVSGSTGAVGMSIGARCFMQTETNCTSGAGKLSCKAP